MVFFVRKGTSTDGQIINKLSPPPKAYCKGTNHAFDGDVSVRRWEDVRERFEDSPKTPEIQDMGSYRDSEKA